MIKPSPPTISDKLDLLRSIAETIDGCLLIGEKVECIHEGGELYNEICRLVTPDYFTDEEYEWLLSLGNSWNTEVQRYQKTRPKDERSSYKTSEAFLDNLFDKIDDMIDDDTLDDMFGGDDD